MLNSRIVDVRFYTNISCVCSINMTIFYYARITTRSEIELRLNRLDYPGGSTNTYQGLQRMREIFRGPGNRDGVIDVAIIITDGQPTENVEDTQPEAFAAQNEGIKMFAVGVTDNVNVFTLRYLSSSPRNLGQNYFTSPNFDELQRMLNTLLLEVCQNDTAETRKSISWKLQ